MVEHVTTNVRLPKQLHRELKRRALEEEKSLAQVIREGLIEYLTATAAPRRQTLDGLADDPFFHITELTRPEEVIGDDRPTDTSMRHDYYLYGRELDEETGSGEQNRAE